jgi:hypothetical protein
MDWLVTFIERLIQAIAAGVEPLVESGNLGYIIPFVLLVVATYMALTSSNRFNLTGYALGWVLAVTGIGLYQQGNGDAILANLTGTIPTANIVAPSFWGFVAGFIVLIPLLRLPTESAQPMVVAYVTALSILLMFFTFRAGQSIPVIQTTGQEELLMYRKRIIGIFALVYGISVLLYLIVNSSNRARPARRDND